GQFLQLPAVAKDFANYLELYRKYQTDYNVEDILAGRIGDRTVRRLREAPFDERLSALSLLLSALFTACGKANEEDAYVTELHGALKGLIASLSGGSDMEECFTDTIVAKQAALDAALRAGTLEKAGERRKRRVLDTLHRYHRNVLTQGIQDGRAAADAVRQEFAQAVEQRRTMILDTSAKLDAAFTFLETVFGESQEMVIFLTELTMNYYSMQFIRDNGCRKYTEYNQSLLLGGRQRSILDELGRGRCVFPVRPIHKDENGSCSSVYWGRNRSLFLSCFSQVLILFDADLHFFCLRDGCGFRFRSIWRGAYSGLPCMLYFRHQKTGLFRASKKVGNQFIHGLRLHGSPPALLCHPVIVRRRRPGLRGQSLSLCLVRLNRRSAAKGGIFQQRRQLIRQMHQPFLQGSPATNRLSGGRLLPLFLDQLFQLCPADRHICRIDQHPQIPYQICQLRIGEPFGARRTVVHLDITFQIFAAIQKVPAVFQVGQRHPAPLKPFPEQAWDAPSAINEDEKQAGIRSVLPRKPVVPQELPQIGQQLFPAGLALQLLDHQAEAPLLLPKVIQQRIQLLFGLRDGALCQQIIAGEPYAAKLLLPEEPNHVGRSRVSAAALRAGQQQAGGAGGCFFCPPEVLQ
ncbi:MAG: hypothetical protein LUF84_05475, partial [Clostridiales bacterium]|nr:hypothetical protein [Clostridiales bacterium]